MPRTKLPVLVIAAAILITALVHAAGDGPPARGIPYRAHLDLNGVGVNTQIDIAFTIFDDAVAGTPLHTETLLVDVANGDFAVVLGQNGTALPDAVFSAAELFVAIEVDGTPLTGRQQIWALPQAVRAGRDDNFTVRGQLEVQGGAIYRGPAPDMVNPDLGLYSGNLGEHIRMVTNDAPVRFFTDGATTNGFGDDALFQIGPGDEIRAFRSVFGALTSVTTAAVNATGANPMIAGTNAMVTVVLDAATDGARGYCEAYVRPAGAAAFQLVGRTSVHRYLTNDNHIYHDANTFPVGLGDAWYLNCVNTSSTVVRQVWQRPLLP